MSPMSYEEVTESSYLVLYYRNLKATKTVCFELLRRFCSFLIPQGITFISPGLRVTSDFGGLTEPETFSIE
jgi:hypothetical protein